MRTRYPKFCKTKADREAYDVAVKGGWEKYVLYPYDLDAIRDGCWFCLETAAYVERFLSLLPQSKGEWAGQPLVLQEFQRDRIIHPLFGWMRPDGTRRFRKGFIFIPKKNGKSTLCAAIALYLLYADGEPGAEVYGCAPRRENSKNVFEEAANMVRKSPRLAAKLKVYDATNGVKAIRFPDKNSVFQVLSGDAKSATGKNVHGLIFDELWQLYDRDLWKDLQGSGISRRQPLMLAITTAGTDTNSLCYTEYTFYKKLLAGLATDVDEDGVSVAAWSYFGFIAEADAKDDPGDPKTIAKANPGLGVSPKLETILEIYSKAKHSPEDLNDYRQLHLNQWVQAVKAAIPLDFWDRGGEPFKIEDLEGRECYAGLDMGDVSDWTAFVLTFPEDDGGVRVVPFIFCPEDRSRDRGRKKVSYLKWLKAGLMEPMEGAATDGIYLEKRIVEICERFRPKQINYDPWKAGPLAVKLLNDHGLPMVKHSQAIASMGQPTRDFMELVMSGKVRHGGHEVLRWCASNLVMRKWNGNIAPDKDKSHEKIDPLVALIMSLGGMAVNQQESGSYLDQGGGVLMLGEDSASPREERTRKDESPPSPQHKPLVLRPVGPARLLIPVRK